MQAEKKKGGKKDVFLSLHLLTCEKGCRLRKKGKKKLLRLHPLTGENFCGNLLICRMSWLEERYSRVYTYTYIYIYIYILKRRLDSDLT